MTEGLEEKEDLYRCLFELESDSIFLIDNESGRILEANAAASALYGYSREELLGLTNRDLSAEPEETRQVTRESPVFQDRVVVIPLRRHRKKDGTVFPVEITGRFFIRKGRPVHIAAIRDISARLQAEEERRKLEERYRLLVQNSSDIIWSYNLAQGRFTFGSQSLERILGYTEEEARYKKLSWFLLPETKARVTESFKKLAAGEIKENRVLIEAEHRHKDGSLVWMEISGTVVRDESGKPVSVMGVSRDIRARKQAEEDRRRLEQRLLQARKAESLGRMAGAIAHHFNNLIGAVMGNLELARMAPPERPDKLRARIDEALKAAGRAAEISMLMLTYLGRTEGRRTPLDLMNCCAETIAQLTSSLPEGVHFKLDFPRDKIVISADGTQIRQILTHLLVNAGEAMAGRPGNITVSIAVMPAGEVSSIRVYPADWQPRHEQYACISIMDAGAGMDTDTLENIFDPFFSTKFTGRGLGIPVVLGLVGSHGGAVAVESAPGKGTLFRVFLPVAGGGMIHAPAVVPADIPAPDAEAGLTVLLVEDEKMVREMALSMLEELGHQVLSATNGRSAVEILRSQTEYIDCVLLDLTMPGLDGWETLAALRSLRSDLPVILASGYDEAHALAHASKERPQAFLQKPYRIGDLRQAIRKAIMN